MKLGHAEIFVADLAVARDFYRDALGCEITVEQTGRFVWLKTGDSELLLRTTSHRTPKSGNYGGGGPAMVFYTDDLPGALSHLQSMGIFPKGYDGLDCCPIFQDPDGHWIQIVNPAEQ